MNIPNKYILATVISFCMFILLGEIFVRLVAGPPASFLYTGSFNDKQTDFDVVYGINNNMRRTTCSNLKTSEIKKIAVIGDSFVFGQGVKDCKNFVSLLNLRQQQIYFENYGIMGSGIDEYNMIVRDMINDDFSAVLLVFFGNDISGIHALSTLRSVPKMLANNLSLFSLLRKAKRGYIVNKELDKIAEEGGSFNQIIENIGLQKDYFFEVANPDEWQIPVFQKSFVELINRLKKKSIKKIYVSVVPTGNTVSKKLRNFVIDSGGDVASFGLPGKSYKLIKDLSEQHDLIFIDTFKDFLEHGEVAYFPHDLHWSDKGHEIMSQIITNELGLIGKE